MPDFSQIPFPWNRNVIEQIIPHRYPVLFLTSIVSFDPNKTIRGEWKLTGSELFFAGHFPDHPVVPGFFLAEALAQAGAVGVLSQEQNLGKKIYLVSSNLWVRRPVEPPCSVDMLITSTHFRSTRGSAYGVASVGATIYAEATFRFVVRA